MIVMVTHYNNTVTDNDNILKLLILVIAKISLIVKEIKE